MRIAEADLTAVPLPASWVDERGSEVAVTREWAGPGPGMREYSARRLLLRVGAAGRLEGPAMLCELLLSELDAAVAQTDVERRAGMRLAVAALRVTVGQAVAEPLTQTEIATVVTQAVEQDNGPPLRIEGVTNREVRSGWLVAAALKQIVINAGKHDRCDEVALHFSPDGGAAATWVGPGDRGTLQTSRHPSRRTGWGLGLVRLCCDAVGADFIAPRPLEEEGRVAAALVLLPPSTALGLPMAVADNRDIVQAATRTWDAETNVTPGKRLDSSLDELTSAARHAAGAMVTAEGWAARSHRDSVWLAVPPADTVAQARDLLNGLIHEGALMERRVPAWRRVVGVAETLMHVLGAPTVAYSAAGFAADLGRYAEAFAIASPTGEWPSPAPSPATVACLLSLGGGGEMEAGAGSWELRPRDPQVPVLREMVDASGSISLPTGRPVRAH